MVATLRIGAEFDSSALLAGMARREKRLAYAAANAINDTAKDAQAAMRTQAKLEYEIRKPSFVMRQVAIIKPFASARGGRPFAIISVGQKDRLLLATLEKGGEREPFRGGRVAVPITGGAARPSFRSPVPKPWLYQSLRLKPINAAKGQRYATTAPSFQARRGLQSTFILDGPRVKQPGVYRRTGPGPDGIELVYAFEENVQLKPTLNFVRTVTQAINRNLRSNFETRIKQELVR